MSVSEKLMICALLGVSAGCVSRVDVPDPPNLDAIAESYVHPKGVLTAGNVQGAVTNLVSGANVVDRSNPMGTIWALMDQMGSTLDQQGISTKEEGDPEAALQVNAVASAHLVCPGWTPGEKPDPAVNGTIVLQTVVRSNRLSRIVWGDATGCKAQGVMAAPGGTSAPVPATFDGGLRIHRFDPIATPPQQGHFLVQVLGSLTADNVTLTASDFKLSPGLTEVRVALADGTGDVIGTVGVDSIGFRTGNGDFMCKVAERRCVGTTGQVLGF